MENSQKPLRAFDCFAGYGGFTLALEKVYGDNRELLPSETAENIQGLQPESESGQARTIGFSEVDKYASAVLKYHWPNTKNYGDITKINWSEVPNFDLLTGGSPCQDLSIAGKRAGLQGNRSGLFYEYMRAVREKRPKYFIWENVKGALSSNKGFDFAAVLNEMAETGYSLWWQVLNAKDFGVPQNRERIFVIGFRDRPAPEVFFERFDDQSHFEQDAPQSRRILKSPIRSQGDKPMIHQLNQPTHSLTDSKIRRLTPTECERLMGLPDGWTSKGILNDELVSISDSQRYKLCGNGVVVNVVETLLKEIILNDYYKNKK
jgi:DNA (cytosine-5)-methyltransferase 1